MSEQPDIDDVIDHMILSKQARDCLCPFENLGPCPAKYTWRQLEERQAPTECVVPPPGWRCTRPAPHDGPCAAVPTAGYHVTKIERGVLGEISKIQEELDELKDAELQGVRVMQLVEASDLIGALVRWLERYHPGTTLEDLIEMHRVTRRAFESGVRKER